MYKPYIYILGSIIPELIINHQGSIAAKLLLLAGGRSISLEPREC